MLDANVSNDLRQLSPS
jgi:hypothetical protein